MGRFGGGAYAHLDARMEQQQSSSEEPQQLEPEPEPEPEPPRSLCERVSLAAAELSTSQTAIFEQEAIITQLQRSYNQQRTDLRAQLGLGPDDDDAVDVRHAKRVQDLQDQIAAAEAGRGSAAPDLERVEAEIAAARKGGDALAAEMAEREAALEEADRRQEGLQRDLPSVREQVAEQEAQLRAQQAKLAETETAANRAQEQRAAALAEAAAVAAAKKARCAASSLSPDAAASLLEMLDGRVKAIGETLHAREREAGALTRTVARERAERALLSAAIDGCSV